jgi:uncharacterized protein YndB with AHSA1/START domain
MRPGKITREPDGYMVVFQRNFQHPIEKVWDALTNPAILKIWFTEIEMDFREGGKMVFHFADDPKSVSNGEIVTIKAPHLFEFTWEGELARWELTARSKTSCALKLTYSRLAEDYAVKAPAGFHIILDQLDAVLNGRTVPYPLGATTEDPLQKKMVAMYSELVKS